MTIRSLLDEPRPRTLELVRALVEAEHMAAEAAAWRDLADWAATESGGLS